MNEIPCPKCGRPLALVPSPDGTRYIGTCQCNIAGPVLDMPAEKVMPERYADSVGWRMPTDEQLAALAAIDAQDLLGKEG